jgi:diguanylate cyclase (GGDEF)-like protein/putative nucleotidyltransferase with HDIG domain
MDSEDKKKAQLQRELAECRERVAQLELCETERLKAEQALHRYASQLHALRHLGQDLRTPRGDNHLLHCILSRAIELAGGTAGELYGYNAKLDLLECAAVAGTDQPPIGSIVRRGEGLAGRVWESGDTVVVEDYNNWNGHPPLDQRSPRIAAVGVPVRHADRFAGVLSVFLDSEEGFTKADTELLSLLASPAALIIENGRLVEIQRRRLQQAETITEVGRTITAILDLDALLSRVVDLIADHFGYYFVHVFEVDSEAGRAAFKAGTGFGGQIFKEQPLSLKIGEEGIVGWVAGAGEPLIANDVDKEPRYYFHPALADTRSELAVPIRLRDEVVGVLDVQSEERGAFDESDLATLETLADQLAVAMENARLYEQEQKRSRELSILLDAAQALASSLDLQEVLETIARKAKELTKADGTRIHLIQPDGKTLEPLVVLEDEAERILAVSLQVGAGVIGHVAASGVSEIVNHAEHDPRAIQVPGTPDEPQSLLCAPLVSKAEVIGVMTLSLAGDREFKEASLPLVTSLASQAATAIEKARLYEETKRLAATDLLTGLWNRGHIAEHLRTEVARAGRFGRELSVLVLDIDNLKAFNEAYGHPAGDEVIRTVAQVLLSSSRDIDPVGRYGGDEFAIVLPETGPEGAAVVAGRIMDTLEETPFRASDGRSVPISISIGSASYPSDTDEVDRLFSLADTALYRAKAVGAGRFASLLGEPEPATTEMAAEFDILQGLLITVDAKDHYTFKHSQEVAKHCRALAQAVGVSEREMRALRVAAELHDVGKIGVRTDILRKPGPLDPDEWKMIYEHPRLGHMLLRQVPEKDIVLKAVLHHHERYDGMGYPSGLEGEEIPLLARILAVADAFSAMMTDRPYRKALTLNEARDELLRNAGKQFDPRLAQEFIALLDNGQIG